MYTTYHVADLLGPLNKYEQKYAPDILYAAGDPTLLREGGRISVVGSRKASPEGRKRAALVTEALVHHGFRVVSGLALGIDTVAHQTAIEMGGQTVAVLGTSLDNPYPKANAALLEHIKKEHLAVSQFSPQDPVHRGNWPQRNRTMALLTDATIIIEASESSGTRHQGWEALRLGRQLCILESVANSGLSWPAKMVEYGAVVLSRKNLDLFLNEVPHRTYGQAFAI